MTTRTLPALALPAIPRAYPEDRDLIVHEIRPSGTEAMVILPTILNRLAALGRDAQLDRSELLEGKVIHTDPGARFMLTSRSLYEWDTKKQVTQAPDWYVTQLALYRGRVAIAMYQRARAEGEFHATDAEIREEVGRAE